MEGGAVAHNFERDPPRNHPCQVWFNLVQRFQRRRFKCEMLTDGRRTKSDDNSSPGLKPGELKSSSLCLYSSNLGTFWLKIEQFWPFEEISILGNGDHLGYRTALTDTILKGDHPRIISAKLG